VKELCDRIVKLQSALPRRFLITAGEKLDIISMCVVPLMMPILRSNGRIRNSMRSSVSPTHREDMIHFIVIYARALCVNR
jgi:hypothetical protein